MSDLPEDRAALLAQVDVLAGDLGTRAGATPDPDLIALCLRLDGIAKTVLVRGADDFGLRPQQASDLRLANALCESDPQGAADRLREVPKSQAS